MMNKSSISQKPKENQNSTTFHGFRVLFCSSLNYKLFSPYLSNSHDSKIRKYNKHILAGYYISLNVFLPYLPLINRAHGIWTGSIWKFSNNIKGIVD